MRDSDGLSLVDDLADDELIARLAQRGHPNPALLVDRRDEPEARLRLAGWGQHERSGAWRTDGQQVPWLQPTGSPTRQKVRVDAAV